MITRRKVDEVAESYGMDLAQEEEQGRLVQHVEGMHPNMCMNGCGLGS